ncbi:MAG: cob(I)yrinic acid a,c-diamide adenosyltransferase [Actinomycetota bacterium]|nr:cob(I)yrinic acid a,c-diamide adenosyltransferase [Actinomycetota bacterium]
MDLNKNNNFPEYESGKDSGRGLVIVNTGSGKGKTTAALGMAMRAAGHDLKVLILQFIKSGGRTGEIKIIEKLKPRVEMEQLGKGFIKFKDGRPQPDRAQIENANKSFKYAREKIYSGKYDIIILDEINNIISYGLLKAEEVVGVIKNKPKDLCVILTGRNAPPELINIADTVTEMKDIKHAFRTGIRARKGIEY